MTANVIEALDRIKQLSLFDDAYYFIGGTALAYYLEHRISEDIDIISSKPLAYKDIIPAIEALGGEKLRDENAVALRMAGLFPDEYMLKFNLQGVKIEFFQASTPMQKEIIENAVLYSYEKANLQILDVKSIAKLKFLALLSRNKSRDLFDFKTVLEKEILSHDEILNILMKSKQLTSFPKLFQFIENKILADDDEAVYLDEDKPINLSFDEIKADTLTILRENFTDINI